MCHFGKTYNITNYHCHSPFGFGYGMNFGMPMFNPFFGSHCQSSNFLGGLGFGIGYSVAGNLLNRLI